ncbi:hypothetical protein FGB62_289g04 [Gracilaria domingensis]|nr:hypothetical protein FGB62_289g04 [Gracilaria domingensis]
MSKREVTLMVMEEDEDAFVDDEEMEESEAETHMGFDDENPEELPEEEGLLEKEEPYDGGEYPAWCYLTDGLRSVHHAVYWHASRARQEELGITKRPVLGFLLPTNRPAGTSDEDTLWLAAVERDEWFCILDGFATDATIPDMEGVWTRKDSGDVCGRFLKHFEDESLAQGDLRVEGNRMYWMPIIDSGP